MERKNIKDKILKFVIIPSFVLCLMFLTGCNTAKANTFTTLSSNMDEVITKVNNLRQISTGELIIRDFMDENDISEIEMNQITTYEKTSAMNLYLSKITLLNNAIYNATKANDELATAKIEIVAKAHKIKSMCDQCKSSEDKFSNSNLDSLKELNSLVMNNCSRLDLSKNEVSNNLNLVNDVKNSYSSKPELLLSRYQKLQDSFNTRLNYFENIISGLDNISNIILNSCDCDDCLDLNYNNNYENYTQTSKPEKPVYHHNKMFRNNIDTYENAGIKYKPFKNDTNGYLDYGNYYNNPNLYNGMGYGNMFGYPYGMNNPYMYGNRFMFPNINTFGFFKNIDTYRPRNKVNKDEITETQENSETNNQESVETGFSLPSKDIINKSQKQQQIIDNDEDVFVSSPPADKKL